MALGFACKIDDEKTLLSTATSITQADDTVVGSDSFNCRKAEKFDLATRLARTFQEDASTSSGEEDTHSTTSGDISTGLSKDSEDLSDDDKSLTPRSSAAEVTSCVYSVLFLLQARAAALAAAPRSRSAVGYSTEPVPQSELPAPAVAKKTPTKARKVAAKRALRARQARCDGTWGSDEKLPACTDDSWVSKQRARTKSSVDDDAQVVRSARSILNKLTIEKFDSLFQQLVDCGIESAHHVSLLMQEIFELATMQHQFIPMYARLCVQLAKNPHIMSIAEEAGCFRHLLLDQCQSVFEQLLQSCEDRASMEEDAQMQKKKRSIGNMKLIGELLLNGMLSSGLLIECSNMLLDSRHSCAEALECLAALLVVAGSKFDTKKCQFRSEFEALFTKIAELTKDKQTPPRVRFLLQDVVDLRAAGWVTSTNQTAVKPAPMKLDEVREQALEEQLASPHNQRRSPKDSTPFQRGFDTKAQKTTPKQTSSAIDRLCALAKAHHTPAPKSPTARHSSPLQPPAVMLKASVEEVPSKQTDIDLPSAVNEDGSFNLVTFRRAMAATLSKLACDKNVPAAVQYIRLQEVPIEHQADQFCDILSRIVEERRGAVRRCDFAFAAGLMATEQSPFDKQACLEGVRVFFADVYADMCTEVARLPAIIKSEFVPTMSSVYSAPELNKVLPEDMRANLVA